MSNIIQNITLNNVASYKEPTEIKDLKKLNFFFGSNGTGKSAIGKYLQALKKAEDKQNSGMYSKIRRIEVKINNKLAIPFTGNKDVDIANMIETLGIRKWVEEGWNQIDKTTIPQKCPFCQEETINQDLIQQFEDYFDRAYTEKKQAIEALKKQYGNLLTKDFIDHLNSIRNYPEQNDLKQLINKLEKFFDEQKKVIQDKIDNTNKKFSIASVNTHIQDLKTVLKTIASNNEDFEKLDEKRQSLIQNIWKYMAFHAKEFMNEYEEEKNRLNDRLEKVEAVSTYKKGQILNSKSIIEEKREETANTDTAKDEINEILRTTGFNGFEIDKKETTENNIIRYYLKRPDENRDDVFSTLSEGEKNFIAFLYFYWLCQGTDDQDKKKGKKKIIVIDDPVSSLDSQALFVVINIIRGLAHKKGKGKLNNSVFANENISQLVVLTHNLFFQKEVSFKADEFLCKDLHYYLITKNSGKSSVSAPSKKELINNDYELLWKSLAQVKNDETLKVIAGNLMRRILQTYLQFTQKEPKEAKILEESNRYLIYRAFMSEINEQSHHIYIMNEFFYQSLNDSKTQDLMNVFESIFNDIGKEHYKVMSNQYLTNNQ